MFDVLSQQTVGKLQRFLELMFSPLRYGTPPALNPADYHRRLYEANVRPQLLDHIGNEYEYHPSLFVRALHEGRPINWVNRTLDWNYSVSAEAETEIGDTHLLVFATVALRRYEELDSSYRELLMNEVREFVTSLKADGFGYENGQIFNRDRQAITPVPLGGSSGRDPEGPAKVSNIEGASVSNSSRVDEAPASAITGQPESSTTLQSWSRGEKIAAWTLVLTILAVIAGWLVVPELRRWLRLDIYPIAMPEGDRQQEGLYVAGTVVDIQTNQPVPQAQITVAGRPESYVSEDNGNFRLDFTPKSSIGHVRIRVAKKGYRTYDASVTPPLNDLIVQLQKQ